MDSIEWMFMSDEAKVMEWFIACRERHGLTDIRLYGWPGGTAVRGLGTDPRTGAKIHLMLNPAADPGEEFDFVEAAGEEFDDDTWNEPPGPGRLTDLVGLMTASAGHPDYWQEAKEALEGLRSAAEAVVIRDLEDAAVAIGNRLEAYLYTGADDTTRERQLDDFKAACESRAPFADYIEVKFYTPMPNRPPFVTFGHGRGHATAVHYLASPLGQLHLNGVTAFDDEDFEEYLTDAYSDPWALLGARNAARDLLAIQSAAAKLRDAERERIRRDDPAADVSEVGLPAEAQAYLDALFSAGKTGGGSHV
ncbi:MAG TPA: hypothetical protein VF885_08620 [Arthrobacter sp.]